MNPYDKWFVVTHKNYKSSRLFVVFGFTLDLPCLSWQYCVFSNQGRRRRILTSGMMCVDGWSLVSASLLGLEWPEQTPPLHRRPQPVEGELDAWQTTLHMTCLCQVPQTWILLGVSLCGEPRLWCFHVKVLVIFSSCQFPFLPLRFPLYRHTVLDNFVLAEAKTITCCDICFVHLDKLSMLSCGILFLWF
jgi:hypothetical protein